MDRLGKPNEALLWGILLIIGGIAILLNNLDLFGGWWPSAWSAVFAILSIGFLTASVMNRRRWWGALVPAFTLLGLSAVAFLGDRQTVPEARLGAIFLGIMGLGFWLVFLFDRDHWWAVIPGGTLWVHTLLAYLVTNMGVGLVTLDTTLRLGSIFFMGLGATFGILYLARNSERPLWWASVPAVALFLFGLAVFLGTTGLQVTYWPVLLIFLGLGLLAGQFRASRSVLAPMPLTIEEVSEPLQPAAVDEAAIPEGGGLTVPGLEVTDSQSAEDATRVATELTPPDLQSSQEEGLPATAEPEEDMEGTGVITTGESAGEEARVEDPARSIPCFSFATQKRSVDNRAPTEQTDDEPACSNRRALHTCAQFTTPCPHRKVEHDKSSG